MKNAKIIPLLLGPVLLAQSLLAQSTNSSPANRQPPNRVALARSPYLQAENESSAVNSYSTSKQITTENETFAQFARPRLGPPYGPPMRPRGGNYPAMWSQPSGDDHKGLGALIGLGVGATGGAFLAAHEQKADANKGGSALLGALIFGGLGAAAGAAIGSMPSFPTRHFDRHRAWEGDGYGERGSGPKSPSGSRQALSHSALRKGTAKQQAAISVAEVQIPSSKTSVSSSAW